MRKIIWEKSDGSHTWRIVEQDDTDAPTLHLEILDGEDAMGVKRWLTTNTIPFLCIQELVKHIKLTNKPKVAG